MPVSLACKQFPAQMLHTRTEAIYYDCYPILQAALCRAVSEARLWGYLVQVKYEDQHILIVDCQSKRILQLLQGHPLFTQHGTVRDK